MIPYSRKNLFQRLVLIAVVCVPALQANATIVQFQTTLGDFKVNLFDEQTPVTVENFLTYVDSGDYDQTIIHRSVNNFIIQGGGFTFEDEGPGEIIATRPAIVNEPGVSNVRGTIAMARVPNIVNSAQSQWFFNLVDSTFLDSSDEGFTVFGEVMDDGMDIVNAIGALTIYKKENLNSTFSAIPLHDYISGTVTEDHVVYIHTIVRVDSAGDPVVSSSSVASSSSSALSASSESSTSVQFSASSESSVSSESSISSQSSSSVVSSSASSSSTAITNGGASSIPSSSSGGGSFGFVGLFFLWLFGRRIHISRR